jgi:tetratricopeptide (TPR) repeat protein
MVLLMFPAIAAPAGPVPAGVPDVQPGLDALRAGRFEEAERRFSRLSRDVPEAPEGPFFQAFEMWWKLLDRFHDRPGMRLLMESKLDEASRRASLLTESDSPPDQERGLTFLGVARLLDAQSKAMRGAHMAASSSARQGHKALTEALRRNPRSADALFAMGAYNYFADNLPALVKGIRFLLMIPGGDRERGLAQLEEAASSSRLFGTEALMLLSFIYSAREETDGVRALGYIEQARRREPDSPLIALIHSDLLFDAGRLRESSDVAARVEQSLRGMEGYTEDLRRYATYRIATSALRRHDPLGALGIVEDALAASAPETPGERKRWLSLLFAAARESGQPDRAAAWLDRLPVPPAEAEPWRRRLREDRPDPIATDRAEALHLAADGRTADGLARLQALQAAHPSDPRLRYDVGRLLQETGRFDEARPHLQMAARQAPAEVAGWAFLRLGWDLERSGRRAEALEPYARAAALRKFTFQPAARLRLGKPGEGPPEG